MYAIEEKKGRDRNQYVRAMLLLFHADSVPQRHANRKWPAPRTKVDLKIFGDIQLTTMGCLYAAK